MSDLKAVFERSSGDYQVEVLEDTTWGVDKRLGAWRIVEYIVLLSSSSSDDETALVRVDGPEEAEQVAEALLAAAIRTA